MPDSLPLRALIVDDERLAREELRFELRKHPDIQAVAEADTVDRAVDLIRTQLPDVVFLDVHLRNASGFDVIRKAETEFQVIFVTGYDEYAIRAFEVNALDYLLKPINPERLAEAVGRICSNDGHCVRPADGHLKIDDTQFLRSGSKARFVHVRDFVCINAAGDYSEVTTTLGWSALVHRTLKSWERCLPEERFVRTHRSCIVNLDHVVELRSASNNTFEVFLDIGDDPVPMSRRYASRIRDRMGADARLGQSRDVQVATA